MPRYIHLVVFYVHMISYIYFIYIGRISQKQRRKRIRRIGTSTRSAGSSHQQDQSVNRVGVSVGSVYQHDHHISGSRVTLSIRRISTSDNKKMQTKSALVYLSCRGSRELRGWEDKYRHTDLPQSSSNDKKDHPSIIPYQNQSLSSFVYVYYNSIIVQ